jgi:hypothetical protein
MAASTLSETYAGTYIDHYGDIVFVFTDKDGNNKSLILQRDQTQGFGSFAYMGDGYYDGDDSPYLPVRLFLPDIKRPDQPTYNFEEIERDEDADGAWIGDQGTLIIHRSDSDPYRMLHVMFTYDDHYELKFDLYRFSPIFNRFPKEEKFRPIMEDERLTIVPITPRDDNMPEHTRARYRDELDDIQKQIDRMGEKINYSINCVQDCQETIDGIADRVSKMEQDDDATNARDIPDSEGFWRDKAGDIWVHDGNPDHDALLLFYTEGKRFYNMPKDNPSLWSTTEGYGPYTKIDNPFIQDENHAN